MPNYIRTRLVFNGSENQINKLKEFVFYDYKKTDGFNGHVIKVSNVFDFNKIVPVPEDLFNTKSNPIGFDGMKYLICKVQNRFLLTDDEKRFIDRINKIENDDPEYVKKITDLGRQYLFNIAKYGYPSWREYRIGKWGTENNTFNTIWYDNVIYFETTWTFARPIVEKLSELFPEIIIEFAYADENKGHNCGKGKIQNVKYITNDIMIDESDESYSLYKELWGDDVDLPF